MAEERKKKLVSLIFFFRFSLFLAPEITLPPVSVSNKTGSNVFLTCEVAAVPLPVVEWVYTAPTGKQIVYPCKYKRCILIKCNIFIYIYIYVSTDEYSR